MKIFLVMLLTSAFATAAEVQCFGAGVTLNSTDFSIENENGNSNNADSVYDKLLECEQDVFFGKLCYKGSSKAAISLLKKISFNLFEQAGEYSITDLSSQKDQTISYSIFDSPNNLVAERNMIEKCK